MKWWVRYNSWTQRGTGSEIRIFKRFDPIIIVSVSPLTTTFRVNKPQDSQRRHRSRTWSVFNTSWQPLGWMNLCMTAWPHFWRTVNHSQLNSGLSKKQYAIQHFFLLLAMTSLWSVKSHQNFLSNKFSSSNISLIIFKMIFCCDF